MYGAGERVFIEATQYPQQQLARVLSQHKGRYKIVTEDGEQSAEVSGRFRHDAVDNTAYPVVGDYVMVDSKSQGTAIIHHILTRTSIIVRAAAGTSRQAQVAAANVDTVFICMSLNNDYNVGRLERYLSVVWNSGAAPVVVLTKSDLCDSLDVILSEVAAVAAGVDIVVTSSLERDTVEELRRYIGTGTTASFIGSSGVGKSTLINGLLGEQRMDTSGIRSDDKGRHTTTHRELMLLPGGGVVIDTPGMRELGIEAADVEKAFSDIDVLAARCQFNDCTHSSEPGCAVRQAIEEGSLDARRLDSFRKLSREARYAGRNAKQREAEKIKAMFGGKGEMKRARDHVKKKNKHG